VQLLSDFDRFFLVSRFIKFKECQRIRLNEIASGTVVPISENSKSRLPQEGYILHWRVLTKYIQRSVQYETLLDILYECL